MGLGLALASHYIMTESYIQTRRKVLQTVSTVLSKDDKVNESTKQDNLSPQLPQRLLLNQELLIRLKD